MDPLSRVVEAVKKAITMSDTEKSGVAYEFKTYCDSGKEFISTATLCDVIKEKLQSRISNPGRLSSAVDYKMTDIKLRDKDGDGKVTQAEYLNVALFDKLRDSLDFQDTNIDMVLSKAELVSWLEKILQLIGDLDTCAEAIIKACTPEGQKEPKLLDVTRWLFDEAFPPEIPKKPMTMTKIIDLIRLFFALSEEEKDRYGRYFDMVAWGSKTIDLKTFHQSTDGLIDDMFDGEKTKAWIKQHIQERLYRKRVLPIQGRKTDIVTCHEYTQNSKYMSMLKTLVMVGGAKFDGDNVMDGVELAKWLKANCNVEDPKAVELVIKEFKREGQADLLIKDLMDGLFDRAFPSAEVRIQEVADHVNEEFKPKGYRGRKAEAEFEKYAKGADFIDLAKVKDIIKDDLDNTMKDASDERKEMLMESRMRQIKNKDRNNDNKITKTEFIENKAYWTLDMSLQGEGDGYDGVLNKTELTKWLTSWCNITENAEDYAEAIIITFKPFLVHVADGELKTADVVNQIFECAFPSSKVRIQKVLESFSHQAGLADKTSPEAVQQALLKSFKGQDTVTRDECKRWLADICGLTSEAYVDALFETFAGDVKVKEFVDSLLKRST